MYDFTVRITTKATVTQYILENPHVQIYFTLKNDKGEEQTWGVETVSPGKRARERLDKEHIQGGDESWSASFRPRATGPSGLVLNSCLLSHLAKGSVVTAGSWPGSRGRRRQHAPGETGATRQLKFTMPKDTRERPDSEQEK